MKYNFTKKFLSVIFVLAALLGKSQAYSENFNGSGSCNTNFPANWNVASTTSDWLIDDSQISQCKGGVPQCTLTGSSGGSMLAGADGSGGSFESAVTASINASIYSSLTVDWNGYRSTGAPVVSFEYSFDDVTYTVVPGFTDVASDDAWHAVSTISLPSACDNKPVLYLRWTYTSTLVGGSFIAFDDLVVNGVSNKVFYWNGGPVHLTTSWGSQLNGSGPGPINFSTSGQTFNLYNSTGSNFAPTLTSAWSVSGGSVNINVGNGTTINTNFTIPSSAGLTVSGTTLNVLNGSTLTLQNTSFPAANVVDVSSGSTIDFAQTSTVTIWAKTYHNLIISGGADKSITGNPVINGDLNLSSATSNLRMTNSPLNTLTMNGTISGTGAILTGNSKLTIGGTGNFGTIRFGTGFTNKQINNFTLNRSSGVIILGTDLTVVGSTSWTNSNINLNGNKLTFNGAVSFPGSATNGAFVGSTTSSLDFATSAGALGTMFMDQTSASTKAIKDITLNRSGITLTLGNSMELWGTLLPTAGTFASGSNLTIKSNASTKGRIGVIGGSGNFTGNPTVEVFKKAGLTNWVNMCSGGVTGGNMSQWNSSFAITCLTCPDGTQVGGVTFTSIYTYDETTATGNDADPLHYIEITALGGISSTEGYWVYIGNGFPNTSAITVPLQGSGVNVKGSASWNLSLTGGVAATNGWHLIANPYPSPISVANVLAAMGASSVNIDNTFYAYDSNLNVNTPFSASGSNSVIPMGQAFSVRTLQNNLSITSNESWKTATAVSTDMLKVNASTNYFWDDFLLDVTSTTFPVSFFANAYFTFDGTYSNGFDNGKDAFMTGNGVLPGLPVIYSTTGGQKYLRNALPTVSGTIAIPLTVNTATAGVFQITAKNFNKLPAGACVTLFNLSNSTSQNLKSGPATITVSANATAPQYELRITVNPGTLTSSSNNPLCLKGNNGSIIAKGTSTSGPWNYTWKDASNNIIKTTTNKATADTLTGVGVGSYQVDVNTVGGCDNANAAFTLTHTSPLPVSVFSVNKDTLNINGAVPFMFTNTSANANTYNWNFGDGNTSNVQNPSYMYSQAGNYTVKLTAINSVCGDSASFSRVVHAVNTPTLQSVLSYQNNDNSIKVGKDARGVFVSVSFDKNTKATITATNILGQALISPMQVETTTDKFYLDLNAKEQIILVTVTTAEKRFTQKIYHNQ